METVWDVNATLRELPPSVKAMHASEALGKRQALWRGRWQGFLVGLLLAGLLLLAGCANPTGVCSQPIVLADSLGNAAGSYQVCDHRAPPCDASPHSGKWVCLN